MMPLVNVGAEVMMICVLSPALPGVLPFTGVIAAPNVPPVVEKLTVE